MSNIQNYTPLDLSAPTPLQTAKSAIPDLFPDVPCKRCLRCGNPMPLRRRKDALYCTDIGPGNCKDLASRERQEERKTEKRNQLTEKRYVHFEEFHALYPEVYTLLVDMLREAQLMGFRKYGIRGPWEIIRHKMKMKYGEDFKMNDHHTGFYAEKIIAENLDLKGFIELRKRR